MAEDPMMKAILKWSLAQSDGTSSGTATEMDPEKKAFLENAMKSMVEDESKTMKELVEAIKGPEETEEDAERKEQALEELIDRSDRVDYAIALHSFAKGLFPTIDLLETSKHAGVRSNAAELVALCVQNNPPCQAWAFEGGALPKLFALHEKASEKEKQKCLLALSGMIMNNAPAQEAFLQAGGLGLLAQDIKANVGRRLRVKALFTLGWMMRESEPARSRALTDAALTVTADLALAATEADDEEVSDLAMGALLPLLKADTAACLRLAPASAFAAVKKRADGKTDDDVDARAVAKELSGLLP